jgi:hypothetical protein
MSCVSMRGGGTSARAACVDVARELRSPLQLESDVLARGSARTRSERVAISLRMITRSLRTVRRTTTSSSLQIGMDTGTERPRKVTTPTLNGYAIDLAPVRERRSLRAPRAILFCNELLSR